MTARPRGALREVTNVSARGGLTEKAGQGHIAQASCPSHPSLHTLAGQSAMSSASVSSSLVGGSAIPSFSQPTSRARSQMRAAVTEEPATDPQMVVEYSEAVLECKKRKEREARLKPNPNYIAEVQAPEVNDKMRAILVDWIAEVHHKFNLDPETLFLAINLFDRFLSKRKVDRKRLQLVGVTCLLIASKYEDTYPPEIGDCVYMTDNAYRAEDVLDTEITILNTLGFNVTIPSSLFFLQQMMKEENASDELRSMAHLMLELHLPDYRMLPHSPPLLAAGSMYLAKVIVLGVRDPWTPVLERLSGHSGSEARGVAKLVGAILQRAMHPQASLVAIRKKFNSSKWHQSTPAACRWLASRGVPKEEIFDDSAAQAPDRNRRV